MTPPPLESRLQPEISVIVCTYNRAGLLREALASLGRLHTGDRFRYEILVVDNASTDGTPDVVAQYARETAVPVRGVREVRQGVSFARNCGLREARGEWIAFFDDDQEAAPDWLLALWSTAGRRACQVVGGAVQLTLPADASHQALGPFVQALFGATIGREREQPYTRRFAPGAGNLMLHRSVFEQVGPFDVALAEAGEDTDLFRRVRHAGLQAWYTPAAVVFHKIPPERLDRAHLVRTAQRVGGHIARRERQTYGPLAFPPVLGARLLQACLRDGTAWLSTRLGRDAAARLDADCRLAQSVGYLRHGLRELAPNLFRQERFFASLNFRADRQSSTG